MTEACRRIETRRLESEINLPTARPACASGAARKTSVSRIYQKQTPIEAQAGKTKSSLPPREFAGAQLSREHMLKKKLNAEAMKLDGLTNVRTNVAAERITTVAIVRISKAMRHRHQLPYDGIRRVWCRSRKNIHAINMAGSLKLVTNLDTPGPSER